MRTRTGLVAGMVMIGVVSLAGPGWALGTIDGPADDAAISDDGIYQTLPSAVTDTIATMGEEPCALGLQVLESQGLASVPENRDQLGFEYDPLTGSCRDFRDALQHRAYDGSDPPYLGYCRTLYGENCLVVGHYACDFGFVVGSGLVYFCLAGLTPYN